MACLALMVRAALGSMTLLAVLVAHARWTELGWSTTFADVWRGSVSLQGQIFPGALGAWFESLPPAVQGRVLKPQTSDYGTLEVGAALGYGPLTLSAARALTDWRLGLAEQAWSLVWALQASGSNADKNVYRLPSRTSAGKDISATQCVRASVAWAF